MSEIRKLSMDRPPDIEKNIEAILSAHKGSPRILRKDGQPLTAGEQKALVLRSENYAAESPALRLLDELLSGLRSAPGKEAFWEALKKTVRHPAVPWFFISQGKLVHLLEWIIDEMEREPLDQGLIMMASEAMKVEHSRYSERELEEIADLIGSLMAQSQLSGGTRSLSAEQQPDADIAPNYMQAMRAKRDIYKALGTLREVARGAMYQRLEGMLSDT